MSRTPLEAWILSRIGYSPSKGISPRQAIADHQLRRFQETFDYACENSPFYRQRLADFRGTGLRTAADIARLPFTSAADLQQHELDLLCVSQASISRVLTLQSSGTTAPSKRLHFTPEDLELTVDFFQHGMSTLVRPGQRVLILMPGELPGSVGDLLVQALSRFEATGIVHGLVSDSSATLERIVEEKIDTLVGLPIQILALVRHPHAGSVCNRLKSVLTSADHLSDAVREAVQETWGVPVFDHYGMTEMGLGGGVECSELCGYHLREADFYWEVIDPKNGQSQPPGVVGEVVFTTLNRRGMPLIRYRTGDRARFLSETCPCGSLLRRLGPIEGRYAGDVRLSGGGSVNIIDFDEALLPLPFLLNYHPVLTRRGNLENLEIYMQLQNVAADETAVAIRRRLTQIEVLATALATGELEIGTIEPGPMPITSGVVKRCLEDRRKEQV